MPNKNCKLCMSKDRAYFENQHLVGGVSCRDIARRLEMSNKTVSDHFKKHMTKEEAVSMVKNKLDEIKQRTAVEKSIPIEAKASYGSNGLASLQRDLDDIEEEIIFVKNNDAYDAKTRSKFLSDLRADRRKTYDLMDKIYDNLKQQEDKEEMILTELTIMVIPDRDKRPNEEVELAEYEEDEEDS